MAQRASPALPPPSSGGGRPAWARLHLWQVQWVRDVLVWGGVLLLVLLGHRLSLVTVPLLLALLLAYLVEPLVGLLTRVRWIRRRLAAGLVLGGTLLVVVVPALLGASFAGVQGARVAADLGRRVERVAESVKAPEDEGLRAALGEGAWLAIRDFLVELRSPPSEQRVPRELFGIAAPDVARLLDGALAWLREHAEGLGERALATGRDALGLAARTAGSLGRLLFGALLTAFFFFFVSASWPSLLAGGRGLIPVEKRERALRLVRRMDRAISGFVRGRLTIALVLGGFYTLAFWGIGVPAPLLWGPAIALLAIVPYASLLGLPVVIALLLLEPHEGLRGSFWWGLGAPIAVYQLGQLLDDYLLTPWIQGESTGLSTPVILFASLAGASLLGFYGLLLAIPLAACLKILVEDLWWPRLRAWAAGAERDFLPLDDD